MADSREKTPRFDRTLFDQPDNGTTAALLEGLLVWGRQYDMPETRLGTFPYVVGIFETLYRDGAVTLSPMEDEQAEKRGPFAIERYADEKSELTIILLYLHPRTIIEVINIDSESEIETVLHAFVEIVLYTVGLYKQLRRRGAKFPHK